QKWPADKQMPDWPFYVLQDGKEQEKLRGNFTCKTLRFLLKRVCTILSHPSGFFKNLHSVFNGLRKQLMGCFSDLYEGFWIMGNGNSTAWGSGALDGNDLLIWMHTVCQSDVLVRLTSK
ncbi:MAG: hypothetical protein J6B53_02000, partial [Clostridia bacterium]|nr:hypothetical protein [Clostridia bacterium]